MLNRNMFLSSILFLFAFPSTVHANPITVGFTETSIPLIFESIILAVLLRSFPLRFVRFAIVWFLVTAFTFACMFVFILMFSNMRLNNYIPIPLILVLAEALVVLAEAMILLWLLKKPFLLSGNALPLSFRWALLYSFIANLASILCGFFVLFIVQQMHT